MLGTRPSKGRVSNLLFCAQSTSTVINIRARARVEEGNKYNGQPTETSVILQRNNMHLDIHALDKGSNVKKN